MNTKLLMVALVSAALAGSAYAKPPEGKGNSGHGNKGQQHGQQFKGQGGGKDKVPGQSKGKANKADKHVGGKDFNRGKRVDGDHRADRSRIGPAAGAVAGGAVVGGAVAGGLINTGLSVPTARGYAQQYGYTNYQALPPGIAKNLARGKPLPPGIAKKMVPQPMLARLPHYDGYEWQVAGRDLILVGLGTQIVAEILRGVF